MTKNRLEAFSDAVSAIILTIMVLELKIPHGSDWDALRPVSRHFPTYVLSFVYLGIYWNNHHHMLHATQRVNGSILWSNLHLLFWLSLVPFVTGWMGENKVAPTPTALYGVVMLGAAIAYFILQGAIVKHHGGPESALGRAIGRDVKGKISLASYAASIPLAYVSRWISVALFVFVAMLWLIPDRRIESTLDH